MSGFLKTVTFGGFDKKDVIRYVDELNTRIFNLEEDIRIAKNENEQLRNKIRELERKLAAQKREQESWDF